MEKKITYEEAMAKLESTVQSLEKGDCALEDMIKLSEEGAKYAALCEKLLNDYEKKLTELTLRAGTQK